MATAELERSTKQKPSWQPPDSGEQILGVPVEIFGCTGPKWSGKTVFGMSLAPGRHPEGHEFAGKERTLNIDLEMSSGSYSVDGVLRIDGPRELLKRHKGGSYKPKDVFEWFRSFVLTIPPGRFDVIMVDPVTDIESGLMDYVRENPREFGYTPGQFAKMEAVAIACGKDFWKVILADIAARSKIFYFTAHEKAEWKSGRPTGKTIAKGLDTLFELSSLYLKLTREKQKDGEKPKPPSAEVLKSRLAFSEFNVETGEIDWIQILPERLPEASPRAIRKYVKHPVGRRKGGMKPEELIVERGLTEDEKLLLQAEIADKRNSAAQAELSTQERREKAAQQQAAAQQQLASQAHAAADAAQAAADQLASVPSGDDSPPVERAKSSTLKEIVALAKEYWNKAEFGQYLRDTFGVQFADELSQEQAETALIRLYDVKTEQSARKASDALARVNEVRQREEEEKEAAASQPVEAPAPNRCSQEQYDAMRQRAKRLGFTPQTMRDILREQFSVSSSEELTATQGDELIRRLDGVIAQAETAQEKQSDSAESGSITKEQLDRLRKLCEQCGWGREKQAEYLASMKVGNFRSLTVEQANALIDKLLSVQLGFSADIESPPGN